MKLLCLGWFWIFKNIEQRGEEEEEEMKKKMKKILYDFVMYRKLISIYICI